MSHQERPGKGPGAAEHGAAPSTATGSVIDTAILRDHGTAERIARGWDRLERDLSPMPRQGVEPRRWSLLGYGLAAGLAAGLGAGVMLGDALRTGGEQDPQIVMAPAAGERPQEVFAAGATQRRYLLPGGGQLELTPGSIVDTIGPSQGDLLRDGLALRLVRGEATLSTTSAEGPARLTDLTLHVGGALITTAAGSMRVRLHGDQLDLQVLDGTAAIIHPGEAERRLLSRNQSTTVPVRVTTASVAPEVASAEPMSTPGPVDANPDKEPLQENSSWMAACESADYAGAVELLRQHPAGEQAALAEIGNPGHLMCISTGKRMRKEGASAVPLLERLVNEFPQYAPLAANELEGIYRGSGNREKAQYYAGLRTRLDKELLYEATLCEKIRSEAAAGQDDDVTSLIELYRTRFRDGPCTNKIEELQAAIQKRAALRKKAEAAAAAAAGSDEADDPYDQVQDEQTPGASDAPEGDVGEPSSDDEDSHAAGGSQDGAPGTDKPSQ